MKMRHACIEGIREPSHNCLMWMRFWVTLAITVTISSWAAAYETDQFTNRSVPIADSTVILNRQVNTTIEEIVANWRKGHDEMSMVNAFYRKLGGRHWVDRLERWAMNSPEVDKLDLDRYDSVYARQPLHATRIAKLFGIGATIRINSQLVGSDKLGHFISQGRKYYRRYRRYDSESRAAKQAAFAERAVFGQLSNGIYSNADLVANYEGHRFYRSLFEDGITGGKPAILRWQGDHWVVQRQFDWADHVNEYWDEALNVSHFDAGLYKHMHATFVAMCPQYWQQPGLYKVANEAALKERYAHLGLLDASELRLDSLCPVQVYLAGRESEVPAEATSGTGSTEASDK